MKFYGEVESGPQTNQSDFGGDPVQDLDDPGSIRSPDPVQQFLGILLGKNGRGPRNNPLCQPDGSTVHAGGLRCLDDVSDRPLTTVLSVLLSMYSHCSICGH